jgi:nucleoside-diphosphate-sugar epimerase
VLEHEFAEPRKPERVVIIGAGGFIGRTITAALGRDGIATLPLTRQELDLLAPGAAERLATLLRPDDSVVFISARAPAKTVPMLMENLRMAETACAALAGRPIGHLLYVSSDAIYADDANPVTESSHVAPSTIHGMMHAAREMMLRNATMAPVAMLRPTLIYGAGDPHGGYGPNRFRREAEAGGPIRIFGEGEERRDHIAVEDVATLARLILRRRSRGALNAVTGVSTPFHDIAHELGRLYNVTVESMPRQGPPPHLLHRHFDIAACHKAFPRFRFTPLQEGLRQLSRPTRH